MSNRSHLTRTVITNKNNVITTVYKKPQPAPSAALLSAPQNTSASTARDQLKRDAIAALLVKAETEANWDQPSMNMIAEDCWEVMEGYSSDTLRNLVEVAKTDLGYRALKLIGREKESEEFLNDWISIEPGASEADLMLKTETMIRGFDHYEHLSPVTDPERRAAQGLAICRVISYMSFSRLEGVKEDRLPGFTGAKGGRFYYLEDEALRTIITTHRNPGAIADLIIERNITDGSQLAALVNNMDELHGSLAEGAL